ncbi:hypothetical protein ATCC90586_003437 [Pythium insidiosum]|nr:hypothetical protein ATCC90586_003437 [Pythium insidiosum]
MASVPMELVVGVIFPAKKIGHLRNVLHEHRDGVRFVLLDLSDEALRSPQDLERKYGPLHVVLHKLAHEMVFARLGDASAARRLALMKEYASQHPDVPIVDPIDSVQLLTDRHDACRMLQRLKESPGASVAFNVPPFRVVQSPADFQALLQAVDAGETALPLICKSVEACATDRSHMMTVVTKRADLQQLDFPVIYQEFINHSGRLFKGYVLGDIINVAERRSLPNLQANDTRSLAFNTQEKYPTAQDFDASTTAQSSASASSPSSSSLSQDTIFAAVRAIGQRIREELKLSLFGFDVIVSDATQEFFVIDVNYFPSYKELEDFDGALRRHLRRSYEQKH